MAIVETPGFILCMDSEGYATDLGNGFVQAYWDAIGLVWTIGFGSTGSDIKKGTTWSRDHAVLRLQQGWTSAQAGVLRASPILSKYPLMLDAITDFAYNCGVGAYQASTLRRKVNALDWTAASNEFPKWNHSQGKVVAGLTVRRARERTLFLSQLSSAAQAPSVASVNPQPKTIPVDSTTPAPSDPSQPVSSGSDPRNVGTPASDNSASTTSSAATANSGDQSGTILGVVSRFWQSLVGVLQSHNRTTSDGRDEP